MSNTLIVVFIVFIALLLGGRFVNESAYKMISPEEREKITKTLSEYRKYYLLPLVILLLAFFLLMKFKPEWHHYAIMGYFVVLILFLVLSQVFAFFKLKKLELPSKFLNRYLMGKLIQYLGFVVLIAASFKMSVFK